MTVGHPATLPGASPDLAGVPVARSRRRRVRPSVAPAQYRCIETHAWWLGTFGLYQYLSEQRLRQWVPASRSGTGCWSVS